MSCKALEANASCHRLAGSLAPGGSGLRTQPGICVIGRAEGTVEGLLSLERWDSVCILKCSVKQRGAGVGRVSGDEGDPGGQDGGMGPAVWPDGAAGRGI